MASEREILRTSLTTVYGFKKAKVTPPFSVFWHPPRDCLGAHVISLLSTQAILLSPSSHRPGSICKYADDTTIYCIGKTIDHRRSVCCIKSIPNRVVRSGA